MATGRRLQHGVLGGGRAEPALPGHRRGHRQPGGGRLLEAAVLRPSPRRAARHRSPGRPPRPRPARCGPFLVDPQDPRRWRPAISHGADGPAEERGALGRLEPGRRPAARPARAATSASATRTSSPTRRRRCAGSSPWSAWTVLDCPSMPTGASTSSPNHMVAGNPDRLRSGPIQLRVDARWRSAMPARDRWIVNAVSAPLLGGLRLPLPGRARQAACSPRCWTASRPTRAAPPASPAGCAGTSTGPGAEGVGRLVEEDELNPATKLRVAHREAALAPCPPPARRHGHARLRGRACSVPGPTC